jgi:hypothetical protein
MVSAQKVRANRANAKRSTGPKSAAGKAKAKQNAIAHGLRSILPVIAGESAKDWNAHLAGIVESLAPVGTLEIDLAGRVALMTWRLRRVVGSETAAISAGINSATAKVRGERDENDSPTGFRHGISTTPERGRGCGTNATTHDRSSHRVSTPEISFAS